MHTSIKATFAIFTAAYLLIIVNAACDVNSLPSTAEGLQSPNQDPVAVMYATGVRLYNCTDGKPSPKSGGLVVFAGNPLPVTGDVIWKGNGIYPGVNGNGDFVTNETNSETGKSTYFNMTLDYATPVLFVPSPTGQLEWARWNVYSTPASVAEDLNIGWGSRVETQGGVEPKECPKNVTETGGEFPVPYTATYYYYPCPSKDSAPAPGNAPSSPPSSAADACSVKFGIILVSALIAFVASVVF